MLHHLKSFFETCEVLDSCEVRVDVVLSEGNIQTDSIIDTIPQDIVQCSERPDITIVDRNEKTFTIIERTIPFEENIEKARERKARKYQSLIADIEAAGYETNFYSMEIGSRGVVAQGTCSMLRKICGCSKASARLLSKQISQSVMKCSYLIFKYRNDPDAKPAFIMQ